MQNLTFSQLNEQGLLNPCKVILSGGDRKYPTASYLRNGVPSPHPGDVLRHGAFSFPYERFVIVRSRINRDYWEIKIADLVTANTIVTYVNPSDEISVDDAPDATKDRLAMMTLQHNLHHNFTIGSDPEIFVEDKEKNMIPAFLFLGGKNGSDRTSNLAFYNGNGNCTMYWDGFQAEFTTRPNSCNEAHTDSVAAGLRGVHEAATKRFPGARLSIQSVFDIPPEMLEAASDEHVAFGCMPSFNAYGIQTVLPPGREVPFRSAGGHIHFGTGAMKREKADPIVKGLDMILGVACVSLFGNYDSPKRRMFYGLPGEYRLPPHGLEYRPLSNAWLSHPFIMNLVIDFSRKAVVLGQNSLLHLWKAEEEETLNTIITCDVDAARKSLEKNKDIFIKMMMACYQTSCYTWATAEDLEILFNVWMNGIESAVADPSDLANNWLLTATVANQADTWRPGNGAIKCKVSTAMPFLRKGEKL